MQREVEGDQALADELLAIMARQRADFTLSFRRPVHPGAGTGELRGFAATVCRACPAGGLVAALAGAVGAGSNG
ncbi:MAG: hypothetical protein R3E95_18115 [Thiolinea sp.]